MGRLICYDSSHNKMVFNMERADLENVERGAAASISYVYGSCSFGEGGAEWACGTYYNDFDMAYWGVMKPYEPFPMDHQTVDDVKGFTIVELINRGYYTAGTTKIFYLTQQLTDYISIELGAGSVDTFGKMIYPSLRVVINYNGNSKQIYNLTAGGKIYNAGFIEASYNGHTGYYFFVCNQSESNTHRTRSASMPFQSFGDNIPYYEGIYNYGGRPEDEIPLTPEAGPIGGYSDIHKMQGDEIDMPTAPDETVSGVLATGFLNVYRPSDTQLKNFGAALWTNAFNTKWYDLDSISNLILNSVSDPINFIVGLFILPVQPDATATDGINLGGIKVNTVTAPKLDNQFKTIPFGSLDIDELYGNYLDYAQSQLSIYLPYIGVADIDVQEVNGGKIELTYIIDCVTGACVANVKCTKRTLAPWGTVYTNSTVHSYTGNVAIQLPISAGSFDTMLSGLINVGLGLGMNQPAKAIQGVGDIIGGMAGDVTTRGSLSSNTGKLCYQTPYLMFTRPIEARPANLGSLHGYAAGVGGKLGSFNGYVECSDAKLDGVVATSGELSEIRQLLSDGVYV